MIVGQIVNLRRIVNPPASPATSYRIPFSSFSYASVTVSQE